MENSTPVENKSAIELLTVLPLRDVVVYPHTVMPLFVGRPKSIKALEEGLAGNKKILLVTQKDSKSDNPNTDELYKTGTVATILQLLKLPDGTIKILVEGAHRGHINQFVVSDAYFLAEVSELSDITSENEDLEALSRAVVTEFEQYVKANRKIPVEVLNALNNVTEPGRLADIISAHLPIKVPDKQVLLETLDIAERFNKLLEFINQELDVLQIEKKISGKVKKRMEKNQREYYLNEKMRAIQEELGKAEEGTNELDQLAKKIAAAGMNPDAKQKADDELRRLRMMPPMSAEATVSRNYIDWLLAVPWKKRSKVAKSLKKAEEILNEEHYGLEKVKERILEYLAVLQKVKQPKGPILCLVGPPGVGKTSLGQSIARATNRTYLRIGLGGVRDEAEIRGHRRTYIGSMPGKIIQKMAKAKVRNPLFMLDEIDKMAMDFRGDPAAALLEVLDPEQNRAFNDHYLEVDYDLSDVMFICTANSLDIPPALADRMEIIRLSGYTEDEKVNIATRHLMPKQLEENGLKDEVTITEASLRDIIRYYTREAGVRNLEREIATIYRKVTKKIVSAPEEKIHIVVSPDLLEDYLGVRQFHFGLAEDNARIGLVNGLAWTEVGGDLLTIEAMAVPGKGKTLSTGRLGDVMQESIQAAITVVRSRAQMLGISNDFYQNMDIHVHVPEGATPKDGPSAGIGMCTALVSALTRIPVRPDVAMTGEITLRGEVLQIGGLKEKLLAAARGGIKKVLIPQENVPDLKEIPDNVKAALEICPVKWIDEVLALALTKQPEPLPETPEVISVSGELANKSEEDRPSQQH